MSKRKRRAAAAKSQPVTTKDSFQNPLTRTGIFMPNALEATQYPLTRFSRDWQTINSLYRSHWVVRRIIDVIPEDMTKNGYKITSQLEPDALKKLEAVFRRTCTHRKLLQGLKWGRLYGGAGGLVMIKGQEDMLDQPLELDSVMPDDYKGLLILDRWSGITPDAELVEDPGDPEYGLPRYYQIECDTLDRGLRVHHSRILRFMGRPLPYLEELAENYWGASEIEHIIDELRKRDNVSWNIAMLTFMANLRVMKVDGMGMMLATGNENAQRDLYNTVQAMNTLMNNQSIQILGENDSYETHQYTFGGLGEVYDRFMMDLAGAAETPVTKLFGRSPAGMNATGESDMQNYYDTIEEKQENELRPVYDKLLPIIMMSTFGAVPDDFDYEFNPVRRAPEDEMADLASKNTDSVTKAFQAGLISQKVALKELRQQSEQTGMWTNITDEDIDKADDEVMSPDEGMGGMPMGMGGGDEPPKGPKGGGQGGGLQDEPNDDQEEREGATDSIPMEVLDANYPKDPDPKNWRTIRGSHVHLTEGKIDGGAGGKFHGKAWSGKVAHEQKEGTKPKAAASTKVEQPKAKEHESALSKVSTKAQVTTLEKAKKSVGNSPEKFNQFIKEYSKASPEAVNEFYAKNPPATLTQKEALAAKQAEADAFVKKNFKGKGLTADELTTLENNIRDTFDSSDYGMMVPSDKLSSIFDSHIKNQFETGASGGQISPTFRYSAASTLYAMPEDEAKAIPDQDMEKYGLLVPKDMSKLDHLSPAMQYGNCVLRLKKDRLQGRVTYTMGDSLAPACSPTKGGKKFVSGDAGAPSLAGFPTGKGGATLAKDLANQKPGDGILETMGKNKSYVELQYHGALAAADIDSITLIDGDEKSNEPMMKTAKKLGIKVYLINKADKSVKEY